MKTISLETQGVRGGGTNKVDTLGSAQIFLRHESDYIFVDDFEGRGDTYKQRELSEILIVENGSILFEGSKYDLFNILKSPKK
jgi:hypothetical protein